MPDKSKERAQTKAKSLLAERARRALYPDAVARALLEAFEQQSALIHDPATRIEAHAGRRAGKTDALIRRALKASVEFPGETIIVVERTLSCMAAEEFWSTLQVIDQRYGLRFRWQHTLRIATAPNGAAIRLMGADTAEAADKIRGAKTPLCIVDEVGAYRPSILQYLVQDCVSAATIDFNGTVILAGTPAPLMHGFFYEACQSSEWSHHHWTLVDNPHIGPAELDVAERRAWRLAWLAAERRRNGWNEAHSKYRREYLGEWCEFSDDKMYELGAHNVVDALPAGDWTYFLGVDVGIKDPCAFTVMARCESLPELYVVESYEEPNLIPSTLAARLERLGARYTFARAVIDAGGQGRAWQEELRNTYGIHLDAADKAGKVLAVAALNGDLRTGRVKLLRGGTRQLREDLAALPWNDDRTDAARGVPDHTCDSFLYCARTARQWAEMATGERVGPARWSAEWWAAEEAKMEAEALASVESPDPNAEDFTGMVDPWVPAWARELSAS